MKLKVYLEKTKTNQTMFAIKIGTTSQAVGYWLSGRNKPSHSMLQLITKETKGKVSYYDFI